MAKKVIDNTPLDRFEDDWGGTYESGPNAGKEWGKTHQEIERVIKEKAAAIEQTAASKVAGVIVNNVEVARDGMGKINLSVPVVSQDVSDTSNPNAAEAGAVAAELNGMRSQPFGDVRVGDPSQDGSTMPLEFYSIDDNETPFATVNIPAPQEMGEVISPKLTTLLMTPARIKLGDGVVIRWNYDCIRRVDGQSERYIDGIAQTVTITVKIGQTTVYSTIVPQVAPSDTYYELVLGADIINIPGTVSISFVASANIGEEVKTSRGSKSVTVITMDLATTFDPASQLAMSSGFTDGQTITIPYTYTVPAGTTLYAWVDGQLHTTSTISGTGRGNIYLTAADLTAGRHNIQLIADSAGLLSNAINVDLLKAGGTDDYIGIRLSNMVEDMEDMPQPYAYGSGSTVPLECRQFDEISLEVAAWRSDALTSTILVRVDDITTQTLSADRTLRVITQRFDSEGAHTLTISNGSSTRTFSINVTAVAGVTETEAIGYRTKLTALGRSNSEDTPADWGGITSFTGVDWRTNGWNRGSDGVDALLLSNGAKAEIDVKPFIQDSSDGDYSIQNRGMTLEMEMMVSQVMERGATLIHCLCDNDGNGYPMGIKITTEEAGLYFGGVEEITTAEDLVDENGNYIDYDGNIVDEDHKVPLIIKRPHGVSMNIAVDRWVHLAFVVQPVTSGYGLAMLFINGVLSRANRYTGSLRQNTPVGLTIDSDKADIRVRSMRYYRIPLSADEVLANWIIDRPTGAEIQSAHTNNAVGDSNNTTDSDGNIAINHDTLIEKGRGLLTIIRSGDSGNGLTDLFACVDKKENFKADLVRWEPPLDANGNPIGQGFEARNVRIRIQGTSSVKYPFKNIRIYLTTQQGNDARSLHIGGIDVTSTAKGYAMRGQGNSIEQAVLCAKTDFVDSSLVMNTGGAHLFNDIMHQLNLDTPPQTYDSRVRQAIDGLPCDVFSGKSEQGTLTYCGQFVLNNEKSKSGKIFGMEGVKDGNGEEVEWACPIALEALNNASPMTLFHPAGSADSPELATQLSAEFDDGFEFNFPEDAKWANVDEGQWDSEKEAWSVKPVPGARAAIKRWMGWIYDCVPAAMRSNPDYGTSAGWSDESKAKWVSSKFKSEVNQYFNVAHLLTYYLFTDYWASVDQRAKNILWRTWDGLIWYATYYDGDTAVGIRNDAFLVYLYNVTRDTYDSERAKYAFEGHSSWLWCLVLANLEDELKQCAANLRAQLTTQVMLDEFNETMQGNWSERQYNKSGKLKYIDTIQTMNYVYTLTGNRELHRTQFLTDRARLLDARYGSGNYNGDVVTFTVVRNASDTPSHLTLKSGDLYYFGYKLNGLWLQGPSRASAGETLTLNFTQTLATNDPLMLGGASCISELDLTEMGSQLNGTVGLSLCTMLSKLIMPATNGVANAPLTLGNISKLEYVDVTGQTAVHTGTPGILDLSKNTRLTTLLAGGTSLTDVKLPEGSPLRTLTLPATLRTLTLRSLPKLSHSGLTLQGTDYITSMNFAECPNLSWQTLLTLCPNIDHVRIEGMSGRVRSDMLRQFMSGYRGLTVDGTEQTYPALIGSVQLIDSPDDFDDMKDFFEHCGLTLLQPEYTEYVFHDAETSPVNVSNEDNLTGYGYEQDYAHSGHVEKVREKSQLCAGQINATTHKMHVTKLDRDDISKTADGDAFDLTDANYEMYDIFMYLPHYWYKGVNNYKNATKHFLLSANAECPRATGTPQWSALSSLLFAEGVSVSYSVHTVGTTIDTSNLVSSSGQASTYRIDVEGKKQVRYPAINHITFCAVFADENNKVIQQCRLFMSDIPGNPPDFDNTLGDYDFRSVPDNAKWLYFTVMDVVPKTVKAMLTDSSELEAIEPDWVEHKAELIGVYQGSAYGMTTGGTPQTPLRSVSGQTVCRGNGTSAYKTWSYDANEEPDALPTAAINGTAQDFNNLARVRNKISDVINGRYTTVPYETSKDMANLIMVWFGTRDVETVVGRGSTSAYISGVRNNIGLGDTAFRAQNQLNKMWGLEAWTATVYEWMDNCCFNAPSFEEFRKAHRQEKTSWAIDYYYNILQQDGNERRVKASTVNAATNVARVRFGRYCDIVASSYAGDSSYATCYAAYQGAQANRGRVVGRSGYNANAYAGVACSNTNNASSSSSTYYGGRLCFFGEIENESVLIE